MGKWNYYPTYRSYFSPFTLLRSYFTPFITGRCCPCVFLLRQTSLPSAGRKNVGQVLEAIHRHCDTMSSGLPRGVTGTRWEDMAGRKPSQLDGFGRGQVLEELGKNGGEICEGFCLYFRDARTEGFYFFIPHVLLRVQ